MKDFLISIGIWIGAGSIFGLIALIGLLIIMELTNNYMVGLILMILPTIIAYKLMRKLISKYEKKQQL